MTDDWLVIGKIVSTQGIKGEMRVQSYSDFPERFLQPGKRWLQTSETSILPPQPVDLVSGRIIPGKISLFVVRLAGIDTCDRAEAMRGHLLLVEKTDRPKLDADEYLVTDLIGCDVFDRLSGKLLGKVIDVIASGNDLLEVENQTLNQTTLIPFVNEIVPFVDLAQNRIEVTPPKGLISEEWMLDH